METKPLLLLPNPARAKRPVGSQGAPVLHLPGLDRQYSRIAPQFQALQQSVGMLQTSAAGAPPEHVVVLEIYGSVEDFYVAVKNTTGMDWLGEWDIDELEPDPDFFNEKKKSSKLSGKLFLVVSNRKAINDLISLHNRWKTEGDAAFSQGRTKWRDVFQRLKTIRRWNAQDRLRETGFLEAWKEDLPLQKAGIRFEAELFFRDDQIKRNRATRLLEQHIKSQGGKIIDSKIYSEIAYHGVVVELPVTGAQGILQRLEHGELDQIVLFRSEEVMFFRPLGQSLTIKTSGEQNGTKMPDLLSALPSGSSLVAVLDGLPMANHVAFRERIVINDPDGFADGYIADHMVHGSEMTSLVVHGDLSVPGSALSRPVYVRPIFQLNVSDANNPREEIAPNILPADITYRAVREMREGSDTSDPAAPDVQIVNLSAGDRARQYDGFMSPWARMLDWLAWKYKILFLVSAGNHSRDIELPFAMRDFEALTPEQLQAAVLVAIAADLRHRRLLAPAESINAVTVGALHSDACEIKAMGYRKNPYTHALPAAYSGLGFGHRHALKPEVWFPGGRQFFAVQASNGHVTLRGMDHPVEPGHLVAGPNGTKGQKSPMRFTRGTSGATAIGSHNAGLIVENLLALRDEPNGEIIEDRFLGLFAKALLTHGATWTEAYDILKTVLKGNHDEAEFNRQIARFLGYGVPNCDRTLRCTAARATLLGRGLLKDNEAHKFEIPLPPSLGGKKIRHRVVITLAWFSPINPRHRNYRKAALWISKPEGPLKLTRQDADYNSCHKGTLHHEVFESNKAVPIVDGDTLSIQVNCSADAGKLTETVPYAMAVTLEAVDATNIPVYEEVRAALMAPIGARSRV